MSLSTALSAITTRIANEFNSVRGVLTAVESQSNSTAVEVSTLAETNLVSSFEAELIAAGIPTSIEINLIPQFEQGLA
jgi:hypothetical protein